MSNDDEITRLQREQLAAQLGLPPTARLAGIVILAGRGPQRTAILQVQPTPQQVIKPKFPECPPHHFEMLGVIVDHMPTDRIRPFITIAPDAKDFHVALGLEVWFAIARLENGRAYAKVTWPPTGMDIDIKPLAGRWRAEDLAAIGAAVKWLETIPRLGRPPGMSDEEAFAQAVQFGLEWLRDNDSASAEQFDVKQLSIKRVTGVESTRRWMKSKHFGIRRVQQALRRHEFQGPGL